MIAWVDELMASVLGQDPACIQHIWQKIYRQKVDQKKYKKGGKGAPRGHEPGISQNQVQKHEVMAAKPEQYKDFNRIMTFFPLHRLLFRSPPVLCRRQRYHECSCRHRPGSVGHCRQNASRPCPPSARRCRPPSPQEYTKGKKKKRRRISKEEKKKRMRKRRRRTRTRTRR